MYIDSQFIGQTERYRLKSYSRQDQNVAAAKIAGQASQACWARKRLPFDQTRFFPFRVRGCALQRPVVHRPLVLAGICTCSLYNGYSANSYHDSCGTGSC